MDADLTEEQRRLQECAINGRLNVSQYAGENGPVTTIYGDPDGLQSLAQILLGLAALDQQRVPLSNLPVGEGFHLHLLAARGLLAESHPLDLGRLDARHEE